MPGFGGRQKARFSPDSRRLLLAGENQPVSVWNLAEGTAVSWLHAPPRAGLPATGTTDGVVQAVFAKDGTSVLTTGYDGTARVWDAATGKPITQLLVHKGIVWDGAFSPDGKYVVTCSQDNSAQVWSVATSQPVTPPLKHSNVTQVCFSPDGKLVLTGGFQSARLWAADTGAPVLAVAVDNLVFSASFSPDGQSFVTASGDGMVRVWNTATGQPVTPAMRHGAGVFMARYSSDGKRLVTASDDAAARVWDATSGAPLGPPLQHKSRVRVAVFSPDDQCVASGGDDGAMRLWDAATGEPMGPPIMHKAGLECVDISPDGRLLVTVTFGRQVCVWRLPAPDKGAADLALFSQLLSASRFDDQGTIVRLEPAHLKAIWLELKAKFPREFGMLAGPTLLTPAAGAAPTRGQTVAQLQQWEFTWAPVPSATAYHLVVATPLTAVPMISDSKIPSHVYRTVARSYGTVQWHWKVRAQVHGIWTSWSEERALPPPKKKGS
jgi:WD40 repeat protein